MTIRNPVSINERQSLHDLLRTKERLAIAQRQISSGKRINDPGDDPSGTALILEFGTSIGRNEKYLEQIESALSFLHTSETALGSLTNDLTRLLELGHQALNGTNTGTPRANLATEVDSMRNNVIALANSQSQGKYLFSGTATLTQPFTGPSAGPITYLGNASSITIDASASSAVTLNLPGDSVFFGSGGQGSATDIFQQITNLRDNLIANNSAGIQTAYDNLKTMLSRMTSIQTDLGGRQAGLEALKEDLSNFQVTLKGIQASVESTDYPEVITDFNTDQTAQEVTLSAMAKTGRRNLFDFIG